MTPEPSYRCIIVEPGDQIYLLTDANNHASDPIYAGLSGRLVTGVSEMGALPGHPRDIMLR